MSKKPLKVTQPIHACFIADELDNFTVTELRSAYMKHSGEIDSTKARKIVYRQIIRLQKLGMLLRQDADRVKDHRYIKTDTFHQIGLTTESHNYLIKPSSIKHSEKIVTTLLDERLQQCEIDLIKSIAESEEYMRLYESLPDLKEHLESNYLRSREYCSKLSGQIQAIKSVISYQSKLN